MRPILFGGKESKQCLKKKRLVISGKKLAVVTSFNWLSFKGDPNREFRDERGTLISDPQKIDELFDSYMEMFNV
jgi:hypothetical protein